MGLKNKLIAGLSLYPYFIFRKHCKNPQSIEDKNWKRFLHLYHEGSFWRSRNNEALDLGKLVNFDITEYEDYKEAISLSKLSGINPMTGESIIFFADSAGTTSYPKEFPITHSFRKDYQAIQAPFLHHLTREFPSFLDNPALYITATNSTKKAECGLEIGYISNFNYRNMPKVLASFYGIPKELLQDEHTYKEWAPVYALSQNLSAIFVITPLVLSNFFQSIVDNRDAILTKLKNPKAVPKGFPPLSICSRRLRLLEHVLTKKKIHMEELWSELAFVCTWKSSLAGMQLPELKKWIPKTPIVDGMYSATEAWFNVPLYRDALGGPLSHRAGIFEFHPLDKKLHKNNLLRSWELKAGEDYEVFVTTSMGMIRYRLKDIVHCSGHYFQSPILYFKYKAENLISLTTLRLSEEQLAKALFDLKITDLSQIRIAPASDGKGLLLAKSEESRLDLNADDFEKALKKISPYYEEERASEHVAKCKVLSLPLKHKIFAQSPNHAQSKPRLVSKVPMNV